MSSETIPTTEDPILRVRDTSVSFDMERGESRVLDDVSIDIGREEILGIVGESGSGKSMFASALLDAVVDPGQLEGDITYRPTDGDTVDILGLNDEELRSLRWEHISMVFQGALSSFNPVTTIRKHFVETLHAHDRDVETGMAHARELLSDLYLDPDRVLDAYPHELSGGMSQRALIALSLVLDPDVLVMDEPTAALDLLMQRSILSLLDSLRDKYELSIVFITHDLELIAGLADRLAVLYAFEFCEVGPTSEVVQNPTHPYTRALLRAVPNLNTRLEDMRPIEGNAPDPVNTPSGCSYHPRCPLADDQCRTEDPSYHNASEEHKVTCFHWKESKDAIPLAEETTGEAKEYAGQQSNEPVISLEDVEVHFEEDTGFFDFFSEPETVHAVDGVDLDVYENDVVALVGESGCGKTTLGKTIIGAQRPTGGTVEYRDQDVWEAKDGRGDVSIEWDDIRRSLQMIHQDPGSSLSPNRTVAATLRQPLSLWHSDLSRADMEARIHEMLRTVGMEPPEDYANRYPHQLSGGEKQRVALIRVLLMNPDLILADEAVSALDVSLRVDMMDLMHDLQDRFDTSFVFISHNLSNARYLAGKADGRIGVMYLGEIVEMGPAEEVIKNPQHPYTKLLVWSTADIEDQGEVEEPPVRGIDIPDPVNPPSGCRFHTRCPEAREVCRQTTPTLDDGGNEESHDTACFREYGSEHPYWDSEPLIDKENEASSAENSAPPSEPTHSD